MTREELILFYTRQGNEEWKTIIDNKPHDQISPDGFAHCEFCSAVVRSMIVKQMECNLISNDSANRYWAGVRLYEHWAIERMFPDRN
jgi:hypothetical protein